ncbi:Wzz/FepE/Etk N-terminal domain-containing protein [Virgibacillus sp. LDC1]|uniref:YveK family protein n=1 Tax=Paenibacillus TaxID=44249 RepID=UPI000C2759B5|nr:MULTISPECIES: Wzz/FepE/Etk N-terminal domain-containing protein [Paenibacillus]MCV4233776.1 Wzz/FepE/Etk N-terminal domain-containing protein [Virgibacillus sp. LDC1]MEC0309229.1 Wzz/FepE/Etk N-terminal domain-containing protein [Paenibacillus lautus]PJN51378.1 Capsular polysaccharide type 8 biosynthesis protein cap8A [Paenibacillus sp. GM2FR]
MELKQYFGVIQKKWWLIAIIVIVAMVATGVKSYFFTTPIYAANAKLIVNQSSGEGAGTLNTSTIQTSIFLINSYKEIIKSSAIMNKVVEKFPDLGQTAGQLSARISVTSANNSQVMNLVYEDTSYAKAAEVVNAVSTVFKEQIPHIMKVDNITILSEADMTATPGPINFNPIMNLLISFVVSLMVAIGLIFLLDYLDDTLKTEADITEMLDVPVLAVVGRIPKSDLKKTARMKALQNSKVGEGQHATINQ